MWFRTKQDVAVIAAHGSHFNVAPASDGFRYVDVPEDVIPHLRGLELGFSGCDPPPAAEDFSAAIAEGFAAVKGPEQPPEERLPFGDGGTDPAQATQT